jgi:predicted nucleotidyltransferase
MISDKDKKSIENIARKYHASNVVLFGSSISETAESRDIDIAVEVIPDKEFLFMPDYRLRIEAEFEAIEHTLSALSAKAFVTAF